MAQFNIKRTDSEVLLRLNADLTGSTVRVIVRPAGSGTSLPDLDAVVTNPSKGEITVQTGDIPVGTYQLEVEQNLEGKLAHYPNKGFDKLIVGPDLDA
jgi:ABC-type molybdate transport system ATPase subunit